MGQLGGRALRPCVGGSGIVTTLGKLRPGPGEFLACPRQFGLTLRGHLLEPFDFALEVDGFPVGGFPFRITGG